METKPNNSGWKYKLLREMTEYGINVLYLSIFFGVFATYQRLILKHYSISYTNYGASIIEALIMGKVILIVDAFRLGRTWENKPLAFSTFYKAVVFTFAVFIFDVIEMVIEGYLKRKGFLGVEQEFASKDKYQALAKCLIVFFAFIPFFAFKELGRVIGEDKIKQMFFTGNDKA
jgi:hypothetical protein